MKVIAFGASTSSTSINKFLASYVAKLIPGADVEVLDINNYNVPMFSEDKEKEIGQAEGAKTFLADLAKADALVISFAEHNGYYPAAYKNLFDWSTRINQKVYQDIPAVYLATSPGPGGAQSVLAAANASAGYFGGNVKGSLSVASFYDKVDLAAGAVTDSELDAQLKELAAKLA